MKKTVFNWSLYPKIEANVHEFLSEKNVSKLVQSSKSIIARGNGRCYGDASLNDDIISTLKNQKYLDFDREEGILECQSGVVFDEILDLIVPAGWFLPVTPGTKFITVGGAIASDVHGKNHHIEGSFSSHVDSFELMTSDGRIIHCDKESNPDLFHATFGGMGLTGILISARFRLKQIETSYIKQRQIKAKNLNEVIDLFIEHFDYHYSVAWIDCLKKGKGFGRSILMLGEHATLDQLTNKQKSDPLKLHKEPKLSIPFNFPSFALNKFFIQAFNFLFYNKLTSREREDIVHYDGFFYPLDSILKWNRMYGKKGFVQYQFVLPLESGKAGLIEILEELNNRGLGSFLAVLKIFGKQESIISFPMEGYTLALDFPIRKGLFDFLNHLDDLVLKHKGRIYLSKDARMKQHLMEKFYSSKSEFEKVITKYNPEKSFQSYLSKRLNIINE